MATVAQLRSMIEELKADENVVVLWDEIIPADPDALARTEEKLGYALSEDFRAFYRDCNGIKLSWISRQHPDFDDASRLEEAPSSYAPIEQSIEQPYEGSVFIPGVEEAWLKPCGDDYGLFYDASEFSALGEVSEEGFHLIDVVSHFNMAAMVLDGTGDPPILMGGDHASAALPSWCRGASTARCRAARSALVVREARPA